MKIPSLILFVTSLFVSTAANAVDLRKINPSDIIGSKTPSVSSSSSRSRHVPYKYASQRRVPLATMYRGSSHERALDAQIRNYRPSAKENERVFGRGFRKTPSKKLSLEDLIKAGVIKVILGADGKKYLVRSK